MTNEESFPELKQGINLLKNDSVWETANDYFKCALQLNDPIRVQDVNSKIKILTLYRPPPFASYYDTIFSNKICRRVFTPLLNKSHHCNPHKITFLTGGQVPSEHYTK